MFWNNFKKSTFNSTDFSEAWFAFLMTVSYIAAAENLQTLTLVHLLTPNKNWNNEKALVVFPPACIFVIFAQASFFFFFIIPSSDQMKQMY